MTALINIPIIKFCPCCCTNYTGTSGESSLYGAPHIVLCEHCWHEEDRLIEHKGTNNIPDRLASYMKHLEMAR